MGEEQQPATTTRLMRTPKEGEKILPRTRRPDGTLRKEVRIRAGYVPPDEVPIYQSKGVLMRKAQPPEVPPGYDAEAAVASKPKTKSAKRNERKKEKKLQAAQASSDNKGKDSVHEQAGTGKSEGIPCDDELHRSEFVETVTGQISNLALSSTSELATPSVEQTEPSKLEDSGPDIDKRIRALKKKIRLAEAQLKGDQQIMTSEQMEKITKIEGWQEELKALENKKASAVS